MTSQSFKSKEDSLETGSIHEKSLSLEYGVEAVENDKLIGEQVGSYQLLARIGEGATAAVFRAKHVTFDNRIYAIKILHPLIATRPGMRERFLREAKTAAQLSHKNIISIHDFAIDPHLGPYMVMEYLHGQELQELLKKREPYLFSVFKISLFKCVRHYLLHTPIVLFIET